MTSLYNTDNHTIDDFYDKSYSEIDNRSEIIENVLKINNQGTQLKNKNDNKNKLTHKDCLLLYLNPNIGSTSKLESAMKHVQGCDICKKELSKKNKTICLHHQIFPNLKKNLLVKIIIIIIIMIMIK